MNYSNIADLAMYGFALCVAATLAWNLIVFGIEVYQDVQRDKKEIHDIEDMLL